MSDTYRPTMMRFFQRIAVSGRPVSASVNGVALVAALPLVRTVGFDKRPARTAAIRSATCSDRAAEASSNFASAWITHR